jgi:hypothetical protein
MYQDKEMSDELDLKYKGIQETVCGGTLMDR